MTILVPIPTERDKALVLALEFALDTTRTVDEIADELLVTGESGIDVEALSAYRISEIRTALDALDTIVRNSWEVSLLQADAPHTQLLGLSVDRARSLGKAIRESLGEL